MMDRNILIASMLVAFFWSLVPIIYKVVLKDLSVETVFFLYYTVALSLALVYLIWRRGQVDFHLDKLTGQLLILFIGIVLFGSLVANYLNYTLLQNNAAYLIAILTAISPVFTAIIASVYLKESVDQTMWVGIILVIIGLVIINQAYHG